MNPHQAFTVMPTHGPQFGLNFIGIYKADIMKPTIQPPAFTFGTVGPTNNFLEGNNQDD